MRNFQLLAYGRGRQDGVCDNRLRP